MQHAIISSDLTIHYEATITRNGRTYRARTGISPANPIPHDAPQEVKDFAAQHWTPEVIQFAKDRLKGARPKAEGQ